MYVPTDRYVPVFESFKAATMSRTTCQTVILVSCLDIDALCACKVLVSILRREQILYRIVPVVGYSELKAAWTALDEEVRAVVMIGCGGLVDLGTYLEVDEVEERKIYVFDSHRPWNLENVFGANEVWCFDDGDISDYLSKEQTAFQGLEKIRALRQEAGQDDETDSETDSDESTDADESDGEPEESASTVDAGEDAGGSGQPGAGSASPSPGSASPTPGSLRSPGSPRSTGSPGPGLRTGTQSVRKLRREYKATIAAYYGHGSSYSSPVVSQMYTLLTLLGDASTEELWLTIVGSTSLDTASPESYARLYPLLRDEVLRMSPAGPTTKAVADDRSLSIETDYRLFLLRHSSLYESMMNSTFMSAKLELWNQKGRTKLHTMLARMGVSLQLSREKWTHTDVTVKRTLRDRLAGISDQYGIGGVVREGVLRKFGYRGALTAGDCVEAVAALLESAHTTDVAAPAAATDRAHWTTNFWTGWDALGDIDLLHVGVGHAKRLQEAVVRTGTALLEKRLVRLLRVFRLAIVKEGPDLDLFANPITLARLAHWLSESCHHLDYRALPLVLAALDREADVYLVLGLPALRHSDDTVAPGPAANGFGQAFARVAEQTNARVRIDSFHSAMVEVRKDDLAGFLEGLTVVGL
ncbi:CDC45 family [Dipodascopsis tothii]|uniref:CDC45 family n=1 Tax=Dipodascopsis tothii TaxID=44089 RepID=UPI0034CD8037